jgi:hypothetical protein
MDPLTKTYVSLGLVVLALFEFITAMYVYGKKPPRPHGRAVMRIHRIGGYVFLVYFVWISWVCVDLMGRLAQAGQPLDVRGFGHGFFAMALFAVLMIKISFARFYRRFLTSIPTLGIIVASGTLVLWGIAGWMFLILLQN